MATVTFKAVTKRVKLLARTYSQRVKGETHRDVHTYDVAVKGLLPSETAVVLHAGDLRELLQTCDATLHTMFVLQVSDYTQNSLKHVRAKVFAAKQEMETRDQIRKLTESGASFAAITTDKAAS
jgi:hypothetical protein